MISPVVEVVLEDLEERLRSALAELATLREREARAATLLQVASTWLAYPDFDTKEDRENWELTFENWQEGQRYAECLDCEKQTVVRHDNVTRPFVYGRGEDEVTLTAQVTAWVCSECGAGYCRGDAEEPMDAAVREHLGKIKAHA